MLLARGARGDRTRALAFLDESIATAERVGADGLRQRALDVRAQASAAPKGGRTGP
jgi:hypothetical protein